MSKAPPLAKPRPTRNDTQRRSILDAASLLFIEKGFGGTHIDIADAVGVTRTALSYHFPSKESMLEALTEEVTEKASRLAQTVSRRDELPPDEALRQLILQHAGLIAGPDGTARGGRYRLSRCNAARLVARQHQAIFTVDCFHTDGFTCVAQHSERQRFSVGQRHHRCA